MPDALTALDLKTTEEERAWQLISNAMRSAIGKLLHENQSLIAENIKNAANADGNDLIRKIDIQLSNCEMAIDPNFFKNPGQSDIAQAMRDNLTQWFECAGVEEATAHSITYRLSSFFTFALHDEWRKNKDEYQTLQDYFDTPFSNAVRLEDDWTLYAAWLDTQIHERVFDEPFGLAQIYIPLYAYYEEEQKEHNDRTKSKSDIPPRRIAVDLAPHLEDWLKSEDKTDAVRVISGGPGSGKSSFAKIFSAEQVKKRKLLFIPMHMINLKIEITEAMTSYLKPNFFNALPYGNDRNDGKILIVFDGLDELSQMGKACAETAREFIDEVQKHVNTLNTMTPQVKVLITGRELVVQQIKATYRKPEQILHILPYYTHEEEHHSYYNQNQELLKVDQRDTWWQRYAELKGYEHKKMPSELRTAELDELTAHPLLNYLIAMSYERKKISFSEEIARNAVYKDLIDAVYERNYGAEKDVHPVLKEHLIEKEQFFEVLEEIAVCAWHDSGRTTTIEAIKNYCKRGDIAIPLGSFTGSAEKGVINLLTAFYFRQSESRQEGENTFEFTHKSFVEYLLARKITRQLEITHEMRQERQQTNDQNKGWSEEEALRRWIILCGNSALDFYSFTFLREEIGQRDKESVSRWQSMLCRLIEYMLKNGMPFERLSPRPSFLEESAQSRNAEEALLAALSACARATGKISDIKWEKNITFGKWLSKLVEQKNGLHTDATTRYCLNHLNLENCELRCRDFLGFDLSHSNLKDAQLHFAMMLQANLSHANLSKAHLSHANLTRADLTGAHLTGADLTWANLTGADLAIADLVRADLIWADLAGADLIWADLRKADLSNIKWRGADFSGAKLENAKGIPEEFLEQWRLTKNNICIARGRK